MDHIFLLFLRGFMDVELSVHYVCVFRVMTSIFMQIQTLMVSSVLIASWAACWLCWSSAGRLSTSSTDQRFAFVAANKTRAKNNTYFVNSWPDGETEAVSIGSKKLDEDTKRKKKGQGGHPNKIKIKEQSLMGAPVSSKMTTLHHHHHHLLAL